LEEQEVKKIGLLLLLCMVILPLSAQGYFTGNGGAGQSITVYAPKEKNLNSGEAHLPNLVQSYIADAFINFSNIETTNWAELEKLLTQTEDLVYAENPNIIAVGNITQTQYILTGDLIKTSVGYALSLTIGDTKTGQSRASYIGNFSKEQLETGSVKAVSADLLAKMGVNLTAQGKAALLAVTGNTAEAQTALAKGITAQRQGGEVASLTYYYQAVAYDPSLLEAASRVSVLATNISSGRIGEDARNDVRWRRDWMARLDEANKFFAEYIAQNQPPCEIVYSTNMGRGKVDYSTETMPFTFPVRLFTAWAYFIALEKSVQAVTDGLAATGRNGDWRLNWPGNFAGSRTFGYDVDFDLVNSAGVVIGTRRIRLDFYWNISGGNKVEVSRPSPGTQQVAINAKVDGITDTLTIKVRAVNGKDPQVVNVSITATNETPPSDNVYHFDRFTGELLGATSNIQSIPAAIWGAPVTSIVNRAFENKGLTGKISIPISVTNIGANAFANNQLTGVDISNSVTSIGVNAFANNQITRINIPKSVTSIGDNVFSGNKLTNVTIPEGVTSIGDSAFSGNKLTNVTIPEGVTSIGDSAFSGNALNDVIIPGSVKRIGSRAFQMKYSRVSDVPAAYYEDFRIAPGYYGAMAYSITIDADLSLQSNSFNDTEFVAFYNKNGKKAGTYIHTSFYPNVFGGTPRIAEWHYTPDGFFVYNGVLVKYYGKANSLVIPAGVTEIDGGAFPYIPTSVSLPAKVKMVSLSSHNGLGRYYKKNGRKAGLYTYANNAWSYSPQ
jgi:hypothetical protein